MIFKYTSSTHRHQDHIPLFSSMQPQLPNQENHILFHQVLKSKFNSEFPSFQPSALHVLITDYFSPLLTSETPADNSHSCAQHFITAARFLYQPLHFLDFSFAVWSIYLNPSRYFFVLLKKISTWKHELGMMKPQSALPVRICYNSPCFQAFIHTMPCGVKGPFGQFESPALVLPPPISLCPSAPRCEDRTRSWDVLVSAVLLSNN